MKKGLVFLCALVFCIAIYAPRNVSATPSSEWTMDITFSSWVSDSTPQGWHWLPFDKLEWFIMSGNQDFASPGMDAFISSKYLSSKTYSIDVTYKFNITTGVSQILNALKGLSLPQELRNGFQSAGIPLSEDAYVAPYAPAAQRWRITDGSDAYLAVVTATAVNVYTSNSDWEGTVINPNYTVAFGEDIVGQSFALSFAGEKTDPFSLVLLGWLGEEFVFGQQVGWNGSARSAGSIWYSLDGDPNENNYNRAPVPEPATMLLLGAGLIGLAGLSRRKFKK